MTVNMRRIFSVFYSTVFYNIMYNTVFFLLTITLIFYSHSGLSENKSENRSENTNVALEKENTKKVQRIKDKLKAAQENMTIQKKKKAALEAQLQELENQVQQLLLQNAEKDSKLKGFKQQNPGKSN